MQTPEASQAEHCVCVPAAQQRVWQSPELHWAWSVQVAPLPSKAQLPETTEYGLTHAEQSPEASQLEQCALIVDLQQRSWQCPLVHLESAEHVVPSSPRHFPLDAV